ncbi:MAG: hypothetical protein Q9187_006637 [Circinaria calcarea]
MLDDLIDEIAAINVIYGQGTLKQTDGIETATLSIPSHPVTLRLSFPDSYPDTSSPELLGVDSSGVNVPKGYGSHVLQLARIALGTVWKAGEVCLFDLIQELDRVLENEEEAEALAPDTDDAGPRQDAVSMKNESSPSDTQDLQLEWAMSTSVTEKKSLFIAHACPLASPTQFQPILTSLLSSDKKVARATHNITAYRIRIPPSPSNPRENIYQDCNDDGETAAGGRLLHLMHTMDVWNVLVVVSRWYGGVKLGPDRFRIINGVAREALVMGGWAGRGKEKESGGKKRK